MPDWSAILDALRETGADMPVQTAPRAVGGGDISAAWRVGDLFVKTGPPQSAEMFAAEAEGLSELARPAVIRVPEVVGYGLVHETAWLATRWIAFARATRATETKLGEQLAALHAVTAERFGWHRNNTIGLTPQVNDWSDDWVAFYRDHRLGFQLQLAADNGFSLGEPAARLMQRIPAFFDGYSPAASLLHGDLWGGNWGAVDGEPVMFDPAVYYGDRETDIAMTMVFGGFGTAFYDAYDANWPMAPGHERRLKLYQLYHILNHLNLFGRSYLDRAVSLLRELT